MDCQIAVEGYWAAVQGDEMVDKAFGKVFGEMFDDIYVVGCC